MPLLLGSQKASNGRESLVSNALNPPSATPVDTRMCPHKDYRSKPEEWAYTTPPPSGWMPRMMAFFNSPTRLVRWRSVPRFRIHSTLEMVGWDGGGQNHSERWSSAREKSNAGPRTEGTPVWIAIESSSSHWRLALNGPISHHLSCGGGEGESNPYFTKAYSLFADIRTRGKRTFPHLCGHPRMFLLPFLRGESHETFYIPVLGRLFQ